MIIQEFFANLLQRWKDLYLQPFQDPAASGSGDAVLPVDSQNKWQVIIQMSVASKLCIQVQTGGNEVQITWNPNAAIGWRIAAGDGEILDNVSGIVYAKVTDPTKSATINYKFIGLKTSE